MLSSRRAAASGLTIFSRACSTAASSSCPKRSTPTTASLIVAQLLYLEAQDPDKDIQFYINSPGGSVTDGMAIYDTMQYIKCDVSTISWAWPPRWARFLLSSGTKGKRLALPNAEIMIHQPSAGTQGQITDMAIHLKRLEVIKKRLNAILADNTGRSVEGDHRRVRARQLHDRRGGRGLRPDRQGHR